MIRTSGNIGNLRITEDMIHARAERENDLEIGEVGKRARLLLPYKRIFDGRVVFGPLRHDLAIACTFLERLQPDFRVPVGGCKKDISLRIAHCFIPPSLVSIWKAAAIKALV